MNYQPTIQFAKPLSKKMKTHFSGSNQSLSAKNFLGSDSRHIRVFTPTVSFSENQYLTCLWSSVIACGVEVRFLQLHKFIADRRIGDVIHLHWIHHFCPLVVRQTPKTLFYTLRNLAHLSFLKAQGHQIVWTIHNTLSHETKTPRLEHRLRWLLSRLCSDILVMSEYSKQEFIQHYGRFDRVHIVPHGNYIGAYPNQLTQLEARQKLDIAPHKTVLLNLGRMMPYKGVEHLVEAFGQIQDSEAVLLIAGSCRNTELAEQLQKSVQVDSRINLHLRFIEDVEIQIYMNASDWVILPYQNILNSGSALLGLSFGRPTIAPQKGSLPELIEDGKQGITYSDDAELASAITRALSISPKQQEQMRAQAYSAAQRYDWKQIGQQLHQIYQLNA